jgi:hypothetical protein
MRTLTQDQFNQLIAQSPIKPRLKRELRFTASTSHLHEDDWRETELLAITDRSGNKGVLLLAPDEEIFLLPFEITRGIATSQTGRAQSVICDFCRTWQAGSNAGSISFYKDTQSVNSVSFLCCADIACSNHVRSHTTASRASRAQLREDLTNKQRVERLRDRLRKLIADLQLIKVSGS